MAFITWRELHELLRLVCEAVLHLLLDEHKTRPQKTAKLISRLESYVEPEEDADGVHDEEA